MTDIQTPENKKKGRTRRTVSAAFQQYERKEPGSFDNLLSVVRDFAFNKLMSLEYEFSDVGTATTADDWAQDVSIYVWKYLNDGKFTGDADAFYAWINRITFSQSRDALRELKDKKSNWIGLEQPQNVADNSRDNNDEDAYIENFDVYSKRADFIPEKPTITVPRWLIRQKSDGSLDYTDYDLFLYIGSGYTYKKISELYGGSISAGAIQKRMEYLRDNAPKRGTAEWDQPRPPRSVRPSSSRT